VLNRNANESNTTTRVLRCCDFTHSRCGGTYAAGPPETCTVDMTSDNQNVCGEAGGTWESGTCTASYNCAIGAMCSAFATQYPEDLEFYTNSYVGHTAATYGCPPQPWDEIGGCIVALNELSHSAIESRTVVVGLRAACE